MLRTTSTISLARAVAILAAGFVAGVQIALYLFDLYDDGTADPKSGFIGVVFLVLALLVTLWPFRSSSTNRQ